eukprot:CAMPEP_0168609398 /NCGR_PEP_ID=MMETSP0449_2-20121227/1182_1 /TAXON_ID=1082188 /ORGANISM="Strombidium rassoulzadegani, Strain ras09" /LENGTH=61 /DNA_ID=CAMNT_0008649533 /DNA_START=453 /DNA_END=635 /DNA_ORIENTATION=+
MLGACVAEAVSVRATGGALVLLVGGRDGVAILVWVLLILAVLVVAGLGVGAVGEDESGRVP